MTGLAGVDEAPPPVYFTGNADDAARAALYSVDYRQAGEPQRLTEPGWWNDAVMDEAATRALVTRSNPDQPPQVYLADAAGKRIAWVEENRLDASHPYAPISSATLAPIFGTLKAADGTAPLPDDLAAARAGEALPGVRRALWRPGTGAAGDPRLGFSRCSNIGSSRAGSSSSSTIAARPTAGSAFENRDLPCDGRGRGRGPARRRAWLQRQPLSIPRRSPSMGWSYGGYMTLKLLEKAPQRLSRPVSAGAPVTSWELYDTHYTERYLGNPAIDPNPTSLRRARRRGQDRRSVAALHGMSDDNVVFENSTGSPQLQQAELRSR